MEVGFILGVVQYFCGVVVRFLGIPNRLVIYLVYVCIGARNNSQYYTRGFGSVVNKAICTAKEIYIIL